jgi:excinuclease UvrABC ATPase subunit
LRIGIFTSVFVFAVFVEIILKAFELHNLDVIKVSDYVIDLGPEGGTGGGQIIAEGSPETVAQVKGSYTAEFLRRELEEIK